MTMTEAEAEAEAEVEAERLAFLPKIDTVSYSFFCSCGCDLKCRHTSAGFIRFLISHVDHGSI